MSNLQHRWLGHPFLTEIRTPSPEALGTVFWGGDCLCVKEEASVLIRLEIAKGKNVNEALYLRFGHAFYASSPNAIKEERDNCVKEQNQPIVVANSAWPSGRPPPSLGFRARPLARSRRHAERIN
ncbi:MAG: hypothetical protein CM15mP84_08060 [Cellvibrionales bacterium]|nr:MAG: hypothetical protein CM15mP84_08060 [Cellvibrionales bacterium]